MGRVSIDSSVASEISSCLSNSCSILNSGVTSQLTGGFQVLVDLGFVSNCLSKIKSQVDSIVEVEQTLINAISKHIEDVNDNEDRIYREYSGRSGSSGSGGHSGKSGTSENPEGQTIEVEEVEDGKKINVNGFTKIIDSLNANEKGNLLKLLNMNKNEKTKFIDLFLNTKNSEELFTLLKIKFCQKIKENP